MLLSLNTRMTLRDPFVVKDIWKPLPALSDMDRVYDPQGYATAMAKLASMVMDGSSSPPLYYPRMRTEGAWKVVQECLHEIAKRPDSL